MKKVTISDRCLAIYPWMKFGYCFVKNLSWGESSDFLRDKQKEAEDYIRTNSQSLVERQNAFPGSTRCRERRTALTSKA